MEYFKILKEKITGKEASVCVLGLGYVGLPLAVAFAGKGYKVYGFDTNPGRINKLKKGEMYIVDVDPGEVLTLIKRKNFFPTSDEECLNKADVIIICVPTPLRKVKVPDVSYVVKAAGTIVRFLRKGQLIVLESTSYPTTTRGVVLPVLEKSGLVQGKDFFLCFSPERVNPGDKKFPLTKIPKVVGGVSAKAGVLAGALYSTIIKKIHVASSPEVAETSKLLENTFRLVNIALVNEFAMVCHKLGIDVWEVIEAAKTKPFGFMPFYPGPGIGGHCIPCDPMYLSWKAKKIGFKTKMIDLAAYINHFMPDYVVERVDALLSHRKGGLKKAGVLILGVTYKPDVKDLRESPSLDIIEKLKAKGALVSYYDPLIPYLKIGGIDMKRTSLTLKNLRSYDCVILAINHSGLDYEKIRTHSKLIFDSRRVYKKNYKNVVTL